MKALIRWCLLSLAFLLTLSPQIVMALPASREEDFAEYDIMFYDPSDSETSGGMHCGGFGGGGTLSGNSTEQKIANYLLGQGFTPAQAAGIIGNGIQESGLWPLALSSSGSYFGVFQWGGSRFDALRQKMTAAGYGEYVANTEYRNANSEASRAIPLEVIDDILRIQLEFAIFEEAGRHDWVNRIKETNTVEEATEAFLFLFEGAIADANAQTEDNLMRFYDTSLGLYYQEARQRREFALNVAGEASGNCGLVAGGMTTIAEAQAWLDATGYNDWQGNDIHSRYQLPGYDAASWCGFPGTHGSRTNCVGFSTYFVRAHTSISDVHFTLSQSTGNGNGFVNRLLGVAPHVAYGTEPQPYAVFSMGSGSEFGHTGVVMGVDSVRQMVITIEAACATNGGVSTGAVVREHSFSQMAARYGSDVQYAYLMPFTEGI